LPETALSSGIKNSGRPLDSGWVVQRFRAALSGPENTSSDLTAKLDSPGAPGVLASAFAFGGSNAVLFFTARQGLDQ